jgi:endonuclease G
MPPLPNCDEPHKVPSGFWKIVAVPDGGILRVAAFIMEQNATRKSPAIDHLATVDEVERRSGLDFFWQPDPEEDALEAMKDLAWRRGALSLPGRAS